MIHHKCDDCGLLRRLTRRFSYDIMCNRACCLIKNDTPRATFELYFDVIDGKIGIYGRNLATQLKAVVLTPSEGQ